MNILFINSVSPEFGGGAEARILEIGKRLVKKGCKVFVLCAITEPNIQGQKNIDGINIIYLKTCPKIILKYEKLGYYASRIFFYLSPFKILKEIIIKNKIDIIIEDVSPIINPNVINIARKFNICLIYTIHEVLENLSTWIKFYGIFGLIGWIIENRIRKRKFQYNGIITVADWVKSSLSRDIPESIIYLIQNGVDLNKFKLIKKSFKNNNIKLLNIGRFVPIKGHIFLLKAIKILLESRSDFTLNLVGTGSLLPKMRKISNELGINKNVFFHGYVSDNELLEFYSSSDVFILSSIKEGFPIVITEAMAMGLPIISTKIPAIEGILNDNNAILVEPANPLIMAKGIEKIMDDEKLLNDLSKKVRKQALEKFDWDKLSEIYLKFLYNIIDKNIR